MTEPTRRRVLGAVAGTVALAGCGDTSESEKAIQVLRSITLETDAATVVIETLGDADGFIGLAETRAQITDVADGASTAILTRYSKAESTLLDTDETHRYTWDLAAGDTGAVDAPVEAGDLLVFRVDDGSGEFLLDTTHAPELETSGGDGQ